MSEVSIGSTIWIFDVNRRVYANRSGCTSGPIYREHWTPYVIHGETKRSWLIGSTWRPTKVPKSGGRGYAFSEQEVDDDCWIHAHRPAIALKVECLSDANVLREIAEIVGWQPEKQQ